MSVSGLKDFCVKTSRVETYKQGCHDQERLKSAARVGWGDRDVYGRCGGLGGFRATYW